MQLTNGSLLQGGKYKIESVLGQGSFGITYLATTKFQGPLGDISVKVAIKEFFARDLNMRHPDGTVAEVSSGSLSGKYAKDFQREAKNLSSLKHPNIINVLEAFSENNTHYYVMEYIDGGNLDDYIQSKGRLNESEALDIASQMASALSYMHSHNMLHLDLKPRNVMRRSDGAICLIDFGLSKQYESSGEPESSTTIGLGTPGYAPLEQGSSDERKNFAPTLDVYALGASIFKMLTGKTPPRASDIMNDGFPSEELEALGVSPETIAMIERMMSPRKKDRPQYIKDCLSIVRNTQSDSKTTSNAEATKGLVEETCTCVINMSDLCLDKNGSLRTTEFQTHWPFICAIGYYCIIGLFWMLSVNNYSAIFYFVLTTGLAALSVLLLSYGKMRIGLFMQILLYLNFILVRINESAAPYWELNAQEWAFYNIKYTGRVHVTDIIATIPLCLSLIGVNLKSPDGHSFWHNIKSAPKKNIIKIITVCTFIIIVGCFAILPMEAGWAGTRIIHELKDHLVVTMFRFL